MVANGDQLKNVNKKFNFRKNIIAKNVKKVII